MTALVKVLSSFNFRHEVLILLLILGALSCKKLIEINPPENSITTNETFADSADASAAILGIYSAMISGSQTNSLGFSNGALTIYCGESADELVPYAIGSDQFYPNSLTSDNSSIANQTWSQAYSMIYQTNACILGLQSSSGMPLSVKNQLIGEAKFLRAYFYFYLVNLFGNVPYVNSISWSQTDTSSRTESNVVYQNILSDLMFADSTLPSDFAQYNQEKIRATKWAAEALLARVYLYMNNWAQAEGESASVINNSGFLLTPDPNGIFLSNSTEAILQLGLNSSYVPYNVTREGYTFIPATSTASPKYYLSSQLISKFEMGDKRRVEWIDSINLRGKAYHLPYKYKLGAGQINSGSPALQYYMLLRLAEQFLIRAEAKARQGSDLVGAINDLNAIRERAGLKDLPDSLSQDDVLRAVAQENRIEFLAEWGHRWLDLKRTGAVDSVMSVVTPTKVAGLNWVSWKQLFPIPLGEIKADIKLTQNPGY